MAYLCLVRPMTGIAIFGALTFGGLLSLQAGDISAREAQRLAGSYSLCVVGMGCGGVGTPILHGTSWEVPVLFGFAGTPHGSIRVDKALGFISYSYGGRVYPTLSPKQLTQQEYDLIHRR
jgi:hypothetical protein